jgi:hypothetical protein
MKKGFAQDKDRKHWCYIPFGFKESIHFVYCSVCKIPMYLNRVSDPINDLGFTESNRVEGYNGPQIE